jgi:hypothetical protein
VGHTPNPSNVLIHDQRHNWVPDKKIRKSVKYFLSLEIPSIVALQRGNLFHEVQEQGELEFLLTKKKIIENSNSEFEKFCKMFFNKKTKPGGSE